MAADRPMRDLGATWARPGCYLGATRRTHRVINPQGQALEPLVIPGKERQPSALQSNMAL
jgi:hypothetical protein